MRSFDFVHSYTICVYPSCCCCRRRRHIFEFSLSLHWLSYTLHHRHSFLICHQWFAIQKLTNVFAGAWILSEMWMHAKNSTQHSTSRTRFCMFFPFFPVHCSKCASAWACVATIKRKTMNKVLETDLDRLCESKRQKMTGIMQNRPSTVAWHCMCAVYSILVLFFTLLAQWQNLGFRLRRTETRCKEKIKMRRKRGEGKEGKNERWPIPFS